MNVNMINQKYFKFIWKIFYEISIFTVIKIATFYTIHSLVNTTGQAKNICLHMQQCFTLTFMLRHRTCIHLASSKT